MAEQRTVFTSNQPVQATPPVEGTEETESLLDDTKTEKTSPVVPEKITQESHDAALKTQIQEEALHEEKLNRLINNSQKILFKTKTLFPFTLFPHTLIISLTDVNVIYTTFFFSHQMRSVVISKVAEVLVETDLFFATLKIVDSDFSQMGIELSFLRKADATRAKRLIQGMIFASKEGIDLTKVDDAHLVEKIEELGRIQGTSVDLA